MTLEAGNLTLSDLGSPDLCRACRKTASCPESEIRRIESQRERDTSYLILV